MKQPPLLIPLLQIHLLDVGKWKSLMAQQLKPCVRQLFIELVPGPFIIDFIKKRQRCHKHARCLFKLIVCTIHDRNPDGKPVGSADALKIYSQGHIEHRKRSDPVPHTEAINRVIQHLGQL